MRHVSKLSLSSRLHTCTLPYSFYSSLCICTHNTQEDMKGTHTLICVEEDLGERVIAFQNFVIVGATV